MIVATAGHVDHGKSTLVRLLTGTDPDRWEEEKRRGLTIDLGFAQLRRGRVDLGFVDVPGHRRYLANMLAGCGAVDLALLVVSAREGWMPQTEEHSQILDLLGVDHGVVALTHADLVDPDVVARRTDEIATRLSGTGLADAPVVATAPDRPSSIDELARVLVGIGAGLVTTGATTDGRATPSDAEGDRPRLWIDRSFTVAGTGRVVTGTLTGGSVRPGDDLHLVHGSGSTPARVRTVHAFGEPTALARSGNRVGIGIAGSKVDPRRGWALARPDDWSGGRRWRVVIRPVRSWDGPIPARGGYQVFVGTARSAAQLRYGDADEEVPAGSGAAERAVLARLHLAEPIAPISIGDRFVLRDEGGDLTIGGGTILAVDAERTDYRSADLIERWHALDTQRGAGGSGSSTSFVSLAGVLVDQAGGAIAVPELARQVGPFPDDVGRRWGTDHLREVAGVVVSAPALERRERALAAALDGSEIAPVPSDALGVVAAHRLADRGDAEIRGDLVARPGARSHRAELVVALAALSQAIDAADLPLSKPDDLRDATGFGSRPQKDLVRTGELVAVGPFLTTRRCFDELRASVADTLADGPRTASELRTALGLSRRLALPLLETLDALGATRRDGDLRTWTG